MAFQLRIETRHSVSRNLQSWSNLRSSWSTYLSVLLTASPKPGVSTMVSFSLTPFSSISTVCLMMSTVWLMRSKHEIQFWGRTNVSFRWRNVNSSTSVSMSMYLQHWIVFYPCTDPWGTSCWSGWTFQDQTPLKHNECEHSEMQFLLMWSRKVWIPHLYLSSCHYMSH